MKFQSCHFMILAIILFTSCVPTPTVSEENAKTKSSKNGGTDEDTGVDTNSKNKDPAAIIPSVASFSKVQPILNSRCLNCHSGLVNDWGVRAGSSESDWQNITPIGLIIAGAPESSKVVTKLLHYPGGNMPLGFNTNTFPKADYQLIYDWVSGLDSKVTTQAMTNCGSLNHGDTESRVKYQSATVPFGSSCVSESQSRMCINGSLSSYTGSFKEASCLELPPAGTKYEAFQDIMTSKCISCHNSWKSLVTEDDWYIAGKIADTVEDSPVYYRSINSLGSNGPKDMPRGQAALSTLELDIIKEWIEEYNLNKQAGLPDPKAQFSCNDPNDTSATNNERLTKEQLVNTLEVLFGQALVSSLQTQINAIPDDNEVYDFQNYKSNFSETNASSLLDLSVEVSEAVYKNITLRNQVFGSCASSQTIVDNCIDTYLNGHASNIFRRPLTASEKTIAKDLFTTASSKVEGFYTVLTYHLMNPSFLMKGEFGTSGVGSDTFFTLTNYEIATRIAFMTTNAGPDSTLMSKVNTINQSSVQTAEVKRLLATNLAKKKFGKFSHYWLHLGDFKFDPAVFPSSFINGMETLDFQENAEEELADFLNTIIFTDKSKYRDLMLSRDSFAQHDNIANIYGHAPVAPGSRAQMPVNRVGVLGKIPFLYSAGTRSSLIPRGVKMRERVLCQDLGPLPDDIFDQRDGAATQTTHERLSSSMRVRVEVLTSPDSCMACHDKINPSGNILEAYDSLGRERTQEKVFDSMDAIYSTQMIDTTDDVPLWGSSSVVVDNYHSYVKSFVDTNTAQACFSKYLYEYTQQKVSNSEDECSIDNTYNVNKNQSVYESIVSSIVNNALDKKKVAP